MTGSIKRNDHLASDQQPKIIGIAGGSGSGKTYFANKLKIFLGDEKCHLILQDDYYHDLSHRFDFDGGSVNFDHPDSLDFELLFRNLKDLKSGRPIEKPQYDFTTHQRRSKSVLISPRPWILVDGILIFHPQKLRELFDLMLFFDTPETVRFQRRLERDVRERGRTPEGVHKQFHKQVKPMHDQYVEPTQSFAQEVFREQTWSDNELARLMEKHFP